MKKLYILSVALFVAHGAYAKNEKALMDVIHKEWHKHLHYKPNYAYVGDWKKIFETIDKNSINLTTFRCTLPEDFDEQQTQPVSIVEFALNVLTLDADRYDSEKRYENAFNALKTLLSKYHVFKHKPCGGDNCDHLIALALESDSWAMGEGYEHLDIVDLLLKYGATANQKSRKDIEKVYNYSESKKLYPHIKAFLNKK